MTLETRASPGGGPASAWTWGGQDGAATCLELWPQLGQRHQEACSPCSARTTRLRGDQAPRTHTLRGAVQARTSERFPTKPASQLGEVRPQRGRQASCGDRKAKVLLLSFMVVSHALRPWHIVGAPQKCAERLEESGGPTAIRIPSSSQRRNEQKDATVAIKPPHPNPRKGTFCG